MTMTKKVTLQINKPLAGKQPDETITLECDRNGTIIDRYWRRRLSDAETDNCVKVIKNRSRS